MFSLSEGLRKPWWGRAKKNPWIFWIGGCGGPDLKSTGSSLFARFYANPVEYYRLGIETGPPWFHNFDDDKSLLRREVERAKSP